MNKKPKLLNLGAGHDTWGNVRVDLIPTPTTTHTFDVNKGIPFPDNYFDEIRARAILEHIQNLGIFVDECYRVLKPNGKLYIRTDNAAYIFFHISKKHEHNAFIQRQYASHEYKHDNEIDGHYMLFVESHLKLLFKKFRNHEFSKHFGGRSKFVTFCLKLLPFNFGNIQWEMVCWK